MRMIQAAVEINARELKSHIEELYWGAQKKVVLLGHSKGGLDAAAACSMFWEDLKDKVVGLAVLQCPYGGSPIAADILREGQIADTGTRRLMEVLICKLIKVVQAWWSQLLFFCSWLFAGSSACCVSSLQSFMGQVKHPLLMLTSMYRTTELCAIIWFLAAG